MNVTVVVATYNRKDLLMRCLTGLFDQQYDRSDYEVIVVDDASNDGTSQAILERAKSSPVPTRCITNRANLGLSANRNRGLREAAGRIVAFVDDDFVPSRSWLSEITAPLEDTGIGGVCGRARSVSGPSLVSRYCHFRGLHEMPHTENGEVIHLLGANMAMPRELLLRLDGFHEGFAPAFKGIAPGGEETELSIRIRKAGYRLVFAERATGDHHQKNSLKSFLKEAFNFGYNHIFLYRLEGRPRSYTKVCQRLFRRTASLIVWPRHVLAFRSQGLGLKDSLVFPMIEKLSLICYEIGALVSLMKGRDPAAPQNTPSG